MMSAQAMATQRDDVLIEADELRPHYDFDYRNASPNRFAERLSRETIVVVLDPDVAAVFDTSEAVNEALRVLITTLSSMTDRSGLTERLKGSV